MLILDSCRAAGSLRVSREAEAAHSEEVETNGLAPATILLALCPRLVVLPLPSAVEGVKKVASLSSTRGLTTLALRPSISIKLAAALVVDCTVLLLSNVMF